MAVRVEEFEIKITDNAQEVLKVMEKAFVQYVKIVKANQTKIDGIMREIGKDTTTQVEKVNDTISKIQPSLDMLSVNGFIDKVREAFDYLIKQGDSFGSSFESVLTGILKICGSFAGVIASIVGAVAPVFNDIIQSAVKSADTISMIFSAVFSDSDTYFKAALQIKAVMEIPARKETSLNLRKLLSTQVSLRL